MAWLTTLCESYDIPLGGTEDWYFAMPESREVDFSESLLRVRDGRRELNVGDRVELVDVPGKGLRSMDHGDHSAPRVDSRVAGIQRRVVRDRRTGKPVVLTNYLLRTEES